MKVREFSFRINQLTEAVNRKDRMSAIFGIGTDIEEVGRFQKFSSKSDSAVLKRIFTKSELDYCFSKKYPASHIAVRFCAKEAAIKALNSVGISSAELNKIEVHLDSKGVPRLVVLNKNLGKLKFFISLSHTQKLAVATVVVTGQKPLKL